MPIDDWEPLRPDPVIEFYKKDVDRSLLRENLKLTPTQRLEKLEAAVRGVIELREAGRTAQRDAKDRQ